MTQKKISDCNEPGPIKDVNIDPPPPYCGKPDKPSQKSVTTNLGSWVDGPTLNKTGIGHEALCDPIQTGQIVNELTEESPDRHFNNVIYRYSKMFRGTDEAMKDLFSNIIVKDDNGKAHPVPIIYGTQQLAVAAIMQDNVRKDNSLVVDQLRLPMMSIYRTGYEFNQEKFIYQKALDYGIDIDGNPTNVIQEMRHLKDTVFGFTRGLPINMNYTLYIWTSYMESMNNILEQVQLKFSPTAYIRVRSVPWEIIVKYGGNSDNTNYEPGDSTRRIVKYTVDMTVETFLPQPIVKKRSVLKMKMDFVQMQGDRIHSILDKIEETVEGFDA